MTQFKYYSYLLGGSNKPCLIRKAWRYQRGNQKTGIEERHTI